MPELLPNKYYHRLCRECQFEFAAKDQVVICPECGFSTVVPVKIDGNDIVGLHFVSHMKIPIVTSVEYEGTPV